MQFLIRAYDGEGVSEKRMEVRHRHLEGMKTLGKQIICAGWVRNEWDGTVSMEIQGTEEAIDKVIMSIESGRYVQIENMDSRTIPVDPEEYGFRTR